MTQVAVIGAGPAGLTAAYVLAKAGVAVDVYEAADSVGGMAKTISLWGQKVDIGPHRFFSTDSRVNALWLELAGDDYEMVDRLTRIYYRNRFFYYPLKPFNALWNLGIGEALVCLASYAKARLAPPPENGSFENWVVRRFGRRLFEIFFKSYTEKLWGIPCTQLDADFAAQRIKKLSLWEALKNAVFSGQHTMHKTLVDQFAYPTHGTGMIYERMAAFITAHGGHVYCNTKVCAVRLENETAVGLTLENGQTVQYDHIISSMPLTLLVSRLPNLPEPVRNAAENLVFRNTLLVYLHVDAMDLFPDNWLYIHAGNLRMGRLTNFRNWVPQLYGEAQTSILVLEYWCYDTDSIWSAPDTDLIAMAEAELRQTGLVGEAQILSGCVHRIPRSYPVYLSGYKAHLECLQQHLDGIRHLSVIGRYGAFKYNNQDHSILMGLLAAENILYQAGHNLWDINTDYENYQEASRITKTGLVKTAGAEASDAQPGSAGPAKTAILVWQGDTTPCETTESPRKNG